ncbi:MAG: prolyl oligopeptidase family serine peptidase, partial [Rhodospirillales bacterium]|nr:prolyl oligopeptidase family serine peptidase [Acetobacter sp.]
MEVPPTKHWLVLMLLCMASSVFGQDGSGTYTFNVTVGSEVQTRTAYIYVPSAPIKAPVPVVFVFHGHGGTSASAMEDFHVNTLWPEAISVYMQGLPTVTAHDPNGVRSGWQSFVGTDGDRDLLFFDQVMATLAKQYPVDPSRIYCTGISNGGYFTYLLWQQRGTVFAAYAPCSAASSQDFVRSLKPAPAILQGGNADDIVSTQSQV